MDAKEVIDTLLEQEGMTRYRLAKKLGVNESLLSRAYNGKSDPGFNEISRWLSDLGYTFTITADGDTPINNANVYDINSFGKRLNAIDSSNYNYLEIHRMLKQILENCSSETEPPEVYYYPEIIKSNEWRAFYAATIAYLYKEKGRRIPRFVGVISNGLKSNWSPIKRIGRAHTEYDETYLKYNVLLPKGELMWI